LLGKAEECHENMCIAGLQPGFDLGISSKGGRTETFNKTRNVAVGCHVKLT